MITKSRACRAIMPAGAGLGGVLRANRRGAAGISSRSPAGMSPPPGARPGGLRARPPTITN